MGIMPKFKIVICEKDKESRIYEWMTVPRKGESVVLAGDRECEVTNALHLLWKGIGNSKGEIMLEVIEKK